MLAVNHLQNPYYFVCFAYDQRMLSLDDHTEKRL